VILTYLGQAISSLMVWLDLSTIFSFALVVIYLIDLGAFLSFFNILLAPLPTLLASLVACFRSYLGNRPITWNWVSAVGRSVSAARGLGITRNF